MELRNIFLLLLAVGYFLLKRKINQEAQKKKDQAGAQPVKKTSPQPAKVVPPLSFDQEAPVLQTDWQKAAQTVDGPGFFEEEPIKQPPPAFVPIKRESAASTITLPKESKPKVVKSISPQTDRRVLPEFTKDAVVQAFVMKEIFTRPPSLKQRMARPGQRIN